MMKSCKDCIHHLVCAVYCPELNDIIANGERCTEFKTSFSADVVPKSEVEKLNKELDELAEEHSDLIVEKDQLFDIAEKQKIEIEALKIANEKMYSAIEATKAEVAREIFAEIDRTLPNDFPFLGTAVAVYLAELKKKYIPTEAEESKAEEQKFFSPEEVRKMTPSEVRQHYKAIMESMKKWK